MLTKNWSADHLSPACYRITLSVVNVCSGAEFGSISRVSRWAEVLMCRHSCFCSTLVCAWVHPIHPWESKHKFCCTGSTLSVKPTCDEPTCVFIHQPIYKQESVMYRHKEDWILDFLKLCSQGSVLFPRPVVKCHTYFLHLHHIHIKYKQVFTLGCIFFYPLLMYL